MQIHLDHELELLKKELGIMCNMSVESLTLAVRSLKNKDHILAKRVINEDRDIDLMENKIDGMLLAILALQQPFAIDLRFIAAAMKINNDLERVADKAVSIAKSVEHISNYTEIDKYINGLIEMADFSLDMIRKAFDCFISKDADAAFEVIEDDRSLNKMNVKIYDKVVEFLSTNKVNADLGLNLYRIATSLERIGDLAKNISEEAVYYIRGEIIKHKDLKGKVSS